MLSERREGPGAPYSWSHPSEEPHSCTVLWWTHVTDKWITHTPPRHTPLPETTVTIISISRPPALAQSRARLLIWSTWPWIQHPLCTHTCTVTMKLLYTGHNADTDMEQIMSREVTRFFLATWFTYSFHMCSETSLCSQFSTDAMPHDGVLQSFADPSVDIKARRFVCFMCQLGWCMGHDIVLPIGLTDSICWPAARNN